MDVYKAKIHSDGIIYKLKFGILVRGDLQNKEMIGFVIYFNVAFNQAFLKSAGNLVTSEKFLGSGIKCDTSGPDYPKVGN